MQIGEKIKRARLARGLTQKKLAGDALTRNMISRIESGNATPSLQTLFYIAQQLSIPAAFFLSEEETPFLYLKQEILPKLRLYMRHHRYAAALELWKNEEETDDELALALGACHLECGKEALFGGNLSTAETHFQKARVLLADCCYPVEGLLARVHLYSAVARNVASPSLALDEPLYLRQAESSVASEFYHYMKDDVAFAYQTPLYARHMQAKKLEKEGHYQEALKILTEIEEQKATPAVHAVLLFRVYADMEICHRELRDYESAYRYSSKRLAQLSAFKT